MVKTRPLVSIICVTYNAAEFLTDCFESIFRYAGDDYELIVIDGESTDETFNVIKEYQDRIAYSTSEPDKGIYDAMNKGARSASGRWLYFLGADDKLTEDFQLFTKHLTCMDTVYYGDVFNAGRRIKHSAKPYILAKYNISHQTIFYPASVFQVYKYGTRYKICADYELNLKLVADKTFKFEYVPLAPAMFGMAGLSSTNSDEIFEKEKPGLIRKHLGLGLYLRYKFRQLKHQVRGRHVQ